MHYADQAAQVFPFWRTRCFLPFYFRSNKKNRHNAIRIRGFAEKYEKIAEKKEETVEKK